MITPRRRLTTRSKWTLYNERSALAQGWGLFRVDSGGIVIQKMDEPALHGLWTEGMIEECPFASDNSAIRFVRKAARNGDNTAQKAVAIHDQHIAAWSRWRRSH